MEPRLVGGNAEPDDELPDRGLRPASLDEYIGQTKVKAQLEVFIEAARNRSEPLDHVLLYGPPGLGKTTLAHIIAREMGANIRITSGPALERPSDLASILTGLEDKEVLFVDEVHRLSRTVEEIIYPAMEDRALDIVLGKGAGARTLRLALPAFTLVGATTRAGQLSPPLRDRFGITLRLSFYPKEEIAAVIRRAARLLQVGIEPEAVLAVAQRSRGTPRVANRLLRRLRDVAETRAGGVITETVALEGLRLLEVDDLGLDSADRRFLRYIAEACGGGPVGVETVAAGLSEEPGTLEDVLEPYLLQIGFLQRTPRGRVLTDAALAHLGKAPKGPSAGLFG